MSIADNLAGPIANTATKAYVKRYDPNKPGFQLIFIMLVCSDLTIQLPNRPVMSNNPQQNAASTAFCV